jgi:hypothetical protein
MLQTMILNIICQCDIKHIVMLQTMILNIICQCDIKYIVMLQTMIRQDRQYQEHSSESWRTSYDTCDIVFQNI